jgi:uncharacterized protein
MNAIDTDEIARLTEQYGGAWGINHTRRLLALVSLIGEGLPYDAEVVWLAAHLHDWGGYGPWAQAGVDHVERSLQVVDAFLAERGCPEDLKASVLECIAGHHGLPDAGSTPDASVEAVLLHDADTLDFLGVVGILRDFSKNPRDLRRGYETAMKRRMRLPQALRMDKSRELAEPRIRQMDELFEALRADSAGHF